ncbi:MAG: PIN domain-containing protein [Armatimonadota bacterium]|nr:PIN domain-containing protein [Armatimonadota bacterium]
MYLVDTNVWLEGLLEQEQSTVVKHFLANTPAESLFITDFSLHSVAVVLSRLKKLQVLQQFVHDLFATPSVRLVALSPSDFDRVLAVMIDYLLDFDDAYQYVAAERLGLRLVSFDHDFDRTPHGRLRPDEALQP